MVSKVGNLLPLPSPNHDFKQQKMIWSQQFLHGKWLSWIFFVYFPIMECFSRKIETHIEWVADETKYSKNWIKKFGKPTNQPAGCESFFSKPTSWCLAAVSSVQTFGSKTSDGYNQNVEPIGIYLIQPMHSLFNMYIYNMYIYICFIQHFRLYIQTSDVSNHLLMVEIRLITWNLSNLLKEGVRYLSTGLGFLPSTVPPQNQAPFRPLKKTILDQNGPPRKNTFGHVFLNLGYTV